MRTLMRSAISGRFLPHDRGQEASIVVIRGNGREVILVNKAAAERALRKAGERHLGKCSQS